MRLLRPDGNSCLVMAPVASPCREGQHGQTLFRTGGDRILAEELEVRFFERLLIVMAFEEQLSSAEHRLLCFLNVFRIDD